MFDSTGILVLIAATTAIVHSFNIDVRRAIVHRNTHDTYFGYSLALYQDDRQSLLVVGAPKAQTGQVNVQKGGAVFRCAVDQPQCSEIFFDRLGNKRALNGSHEVPIEEKSRQWFGATVVTSKNGYNVLACAPHYKYFFSKFEVIEPVGTCYYARDAFENVQEFSPCRQEPARHGHHRFGYGMCGFSAAIPDDGESRLYVGAPGVYYWQGSVFFQDINEPNQRPNLPDGPADTDHYMLGYATATGDFNGDKIDDVVTGVPRANNLEGQISIYDHRQRFLRNITDSKEGGQRGQFFGASLAVTDLNGDGLDDIIVGAPFYTEYTTDKNQESKPQYDVGKVIVFFQGRDHAFSKSETIKGQTEWARFGYSIAAAGDLNGDGYNDFIVGAPYDGQDARGAVYVFHGAKTGVRVEYTQKIDASEIDGQLRTFGFAVAGGRDVDGNGYPDIAVGAWQSAQAVVLKSKPIISISGYVRPNKKTINLDNKRCASEFGSIACEKMKFCLKYDGRESPNRIELKLHIQVDAKKRLSPRAFFSKRDFGTRAIRPDARSQSFAQPDTIVQTINLQKGVEFCDNHDFYVPDTIRDKLTPIHVSVNYTYEPSRSGLTSSGQLEPAIDTTLPQAFTGQVDIERNCGSDNECVPDLVMTVKTNKDKFTLGAVDNSLILDTSVRNVREDAYEAQFFITIPDGFEYSGIENKAKLPVSCSPPAIVPDRTEPYTFVCDIGNPLIRDAEVKFNFLLTAVNVDASLDAIVVDMHVNSTNAEDNATMKNNQVNLVVPLEIKTQLTLTGKSIPEQVDYSVRNRTLGKDAAFDSDVGPIVSHLYQVGNRGPSAINGVLLDIFWPSYVEGGNQHLMYLIDEPIVSDRKKVACRVKQNYNVNPESLTISNEHLSVITTQQSQMMMMRLRRSADDELELRTSAPPKSTRSQFRDAIMQAKSTGASAEYRGALSRASVNCDDLKCTHIECEIKQLKEDEYVLVQIFSRLWINTLIDDTIYEADISSMAIAKVSSGAATPKGYTPPTHLLAVTTDVNPTDPELSQRPVPWWLYLLAILAGIAILLLLALCLWRCGFFKRNRPHAEKAKLDRGVEQSHYADAGSRYSHPHLISPERHGYQL